MRVRLPVVAGTFYPRRRAALQATVDDLLASTTPSLPDGPVPKAIVGPHAGYRYSGPIAATAYRAIRPRRHDITRVVLAGPSHRTRFDGLAVPTVDAFATPLGDVAIDRSARELAASSTGVVLDDRPHRDEHSLEVHLPLLQRSLGDDWELLPIAVGRATPAMVADVLTALWGGPETLVVVSTDLSHYHDYTTANALDRRTADAVVRADVDAIGLTDACGATPLRGLLELARRDALSIELVDLRNSADTSGDRDRVVGYGAFVVA
jgi:AmmeMemoRadiSam system protein B